MHRIWGRDWERGNKLQKPPSLSLVSKSLSRSVPLPPSLPPLSLLSLPSSNLPLASSLLHSPFPFLLHMLPPLSSHPATLPSSVSPISPSPPSRSAISSSVAPSLAPLLLPRALAPSLLPSLSLSLTLALSHPPPLVPLFTRRLSFPCSLFHFFPLFLAEYLTFHAAISYDSGPRFRL